jgi:molecular chaperone GrpE
VTNQHGNRQEEEPKVVIRDRRRIDPETGAPRAGARVSGAVAPVTRGAGAGTRSGQATEKKAAERKAEAKELAALRSEVEELTRDVQRITAEYANYRKRVDRDRLAVVEQATGAILTTLLPVLDDINRARAHGDLTGAFASVAEQLQKTLTKLGLASFGEVGDVFDPTWHEAVAHSTSPDVDEPTCVEVLRPGYALGDRLLRAAMVAVAEPAEPAPGGPPGIEFGEAANDSSAADIRST